MGIMLGYDRLAQCRRYLIRHRGHARLKLPGARQPDVWVEPAPHAVAARPGFTLIELLIVIGLLGAVAMVLLASFNINREQTLDHSIVQKELSDIQRAFHRSNADCVLQDADLKRIAQYGLAVLMQRVADDGTVLADEVWDADRGRGWRGPDVEREGDREINPDSIGQEPGTEIVPVLETPYVSTHDDGHYYRVVATEWDTTGPEPVERVIVPTGDIHQLWVVAPDSGGLPVAGDLIEAFPKEFRRRLLLDRE